MYVYVWKIDFNNGGDHSCGDCFAVAFSKEEAIKKIVEAFKTAHKDDYNVDVNCELLQNQLAHDDQYQVIQVEKFSYPPGGDRFYKDGIHFYYPANP